MVEMLTHLIPIGIVILVIIAIICFLLKIYKVADVDKALIITGGKDPVIKVSGGSFVIPIFRKHEYFDLCTITVSTTADEIKTKTSVPIVINWTAQIKPDINDMDALKRCIISFKERGENGIRNDVGLTLMGAVRNVVATMTPEEVNTDIEKFKKAVEDNVKDEMRNMGLELISLNVQDITDRNGYYDNIAALDSEGKRLAAQNVRASTDQQIREQVANSEKIASETELKSKLEIAAKQKDNDIQMAQFKIETDKANADAEIAGELQKTTRHQELALEQGKVEIVRQEQANLAAEKKQSVIKTEAESDRIRAEIEATKNANVEVKKAEANAKVIEATAEAKAKQVEIESKANANQIKITGEAEAEKIASVGKANAEAEKQMLLAKAEGERALAEARAGNDKVNFEIEKIKIENNAKVQIASHMATVMAEVGKNAEFVNIGGSASGKSGNVLLDTLSGIPQLLKTLDVENNALNGESFNDSINQVVEAITSPLKGLGVLSTSNNNSNTNVALDGSTESVGEITEGSSTN